MLTTNDAGGLGYSISQNDQLKRILALSGNDNKYNLYPSTEESALIACEYIKVAPKPKECLEFLAWFLAYHPITSIRNKIAESIRTPTDLSLFLGYYKGHKKLGGRCLKKMINSFFIINEKKMERWCLQFAQREGFTLGDILRIGHPKYLPGDLCDYILRGTIPPNRPLIQAAHKIKEGNLSVLQDWHIPLECIPNAVKTNKEFWQAYVKYLKGTALLRHLNKLAEYSIEPQNLDTLKELHPFNILLAWGTYAKGSGMLGSKSWIPKPHITKFLEEYYLNTKSTPSGKKFFVSVDQSSSMDMCCPSAPFWNLWQVGNRIAYLLHKNEDSYMSVFAQECKLNTQPTNFDTRMIKGGTDGASPIIFALDKNIRVDTFVTITDGDTWAGEWSVEEAMRRYRDQINPKAKLITVNLSGKSRTTMMPTSKNNMDITGLNNDLYETIVNFAGEE